MQHLCQRDLFNGRVDMQDGLVSSRDDVLVVQNADGGLESGDCVHWFLGTAEHEPKQDILCAMTEK